MSKRKRKANRTEEWWFIQDLERLGAELNRIATETPMDPDDKTYAASDAANQIYFDIMRKMHNSSASEFHRAVMIANAANALLLSWDERKPGELASTFMRMDIEGRMPGGDS